jgi:crossover junction endodeoxyribonuclease RuvC
VYTSWLGIDPGLHGGIAVQHTNKPTMAVAMPLKDGNLDLEKISDIVDSMLLVDQLDQSWGYRTCRVVIEGVGAMPGQGVSSTFKFGFVTGAVHGIMAAKGLEVVVCYPVKWKNRVLTGTDKSKQAAIDYCRLSFPDISLLATPRSRKPHDGIADALCISQYARHHHEENIKHKSNVVRVNKRV